MTSQPMAAQIEVGHHTVWKLFGITLNGDTITSTLVAGAIIIVLGLLLRRGVSATKPTRIQLFWETVVKQVEQQVEDSMGVKTAPFVVPLAMALFVYILIANLIALVPSGHNPEYLPPPAADVNFVYPLTLLVIIWMYIAGIRKKGFRGYFHHLFVPYKAMFPLHLISELTRPISLSLRLFGNIFAGTIMIGLFTLMPSYILWLPNLLWRPFDAFIGLIQAFIFALLTILYFSSVAPEEAEHADAHS